MTEARGRRGSRRSRSSCGTASPTPTARREVARELIVDEGIALLVAASTPETTNPVATVAEIEEFPCITTMAPWQPWYIGRQGNPGDPASWTPFNYTYHYFWGLEDIIAVFAGDVGPARHQQEGRRAVPQRRRRQCLGRSQCRHRAGPRAGGRLQRRRSGPLPEPAGRLLGADQRVQGRQGRDRHRRGDPAGLHDVLDPGEPAGLQAEGGDGRRRRSCSRPRSRRSATARAQPLVRSLVDAEPSVQVVAQRPDRAADVAAAFTAASSRPWTQPIGFIHSLFEVAIDVLKRSGSTEPDAIVEAIKATNLDTLTGKVQWGTDTGRSARSAPMSARRRWSAGSGGARTTTRSTSSSSTTATRRKFRRVARWKPCLA